MYYWLYTRDADRPLKTFDIAYSTDGGTSFSTPQAAADLNMADWSIGPGDRSDAYVESRTFDTLSGVTNIRCLGFRSTLPLPGNRTSVS